MWLVCRDQGILPEPVEEVKSNRPADLQVSLSLSIYIYIYTYIQNKYIYIYRYREDPVEDAAVAAGWRLVQAGRGQDNCL